MATDEETPRESQGQPLAAEDRYRELIQRLDRRWRQVRRATASRDAPKLMTLNQTGDGTDVSQAAARCAERKVLHERI